MARQVIAWLWTVLALFLAAQGVGSPSAYAVEIKGRDSGSCGGLTTLCGEGLPHFEYDVHWKVWTLLGEVVTNAEIKWRFTDRTNLPLPEPPGGQASIRDVPEAAWKRVALYDAKLELLGRIENKLWQRFSIVIDLGVPWKPGDDKWSFNVPGSPEWGKLFTPLGNGPHLSANEAKAAFNKGFVVESVRLVDPKMSFVAFHDKLLESRGDWRAELMRRTVEDQIDIVERFAGLPTGKLRDRLAKADAALKKNPRQVPADLQKLFDKLNSGVPEKYIPPARRTAYRRAREKAAQDGIREVKLLQPGGRSDGYADWRKTAETELKNRKPLVSLENDKLVGYWVNQPQSNRCQLNALKKHRWEFRGDGRVRFISTNGVVLVGTWFPNPDVQPDGKGMRTVQLEHNGKKYDQLFDFLGEQSSEYDPVFAIRSVSMPASVEGVRDMNNHNSLCPVGAGWFKDAGKW